MIRPHIVLEMEFLEPENGGSTLDQVLEHISGLQNPVVCFIKAGEPSFSHKWINQFDVFVQNLKTQRPDVIAHLTASAFHRDQEKQLLEIFDSVIFVIADLVRPYYNLIEKPACKMSERWKSGSEHFLFLTGKPNKLHRIGLLYQLDRLGILEHSIWSLYMTDLLLDPCSTILKDLGCEDTVDWIKNHLRSPDRADVIVTDNNGLHYNGIPFGFELYDNPKFQLVSETVFESNQPPWITEKVILAIANKNPFLLAGVPGTLSMMKNIGFKTFENYCLHQDYDFDRDERSRLLKISENAKFWLENLESYKHEIEQDLDDNFSLFVELGKKYLNDAQRAIDFLGIDCDVADILPIFDPIKHQDWKQWYSRIRDPQWPDCDREEDFCHLPDWIQRECIDVFGYNPKEKNDHRNLWIYR